jgi:hypothetical protein
MIAEEKKAEQMLKKEVERYEYAEKKTLFVSIPPLYY